jgi:ATP-binding protein involved in chromosome partitioning
VYGPSLPSLIVPSDKTVKKSPRYPDMILPLPGPHGLKLLSFGFVNPKAARGAGGGQAAVLRGPMVTKVISQLVSSTDWGDLDYLVREMPKF